MYILNKNKVLHSRSWDACVINDVLLNLGIDRKNSSEATARVHYRGYSTDAAAAAAQSNASCESCARNNASCASCAQSNASCESCAQSNASCESCAQSNASLIHALSTTFYYVAQRTHITHSLSLSCHIPVLAYPKVVFS